MSHSSVIILTLIFSAFFSGLEIAFISANKLKIEVDKNKGMFYAGILSDLNKTPSHFIGAMLLGNNVSLVIYGMAMAQALHPVLVNILPGKHVQEIWILIVQTFIAAMLILVTAEFIPKALFRINPNLVLRYLAIPAWFFYVIFYPVIFLFTKMSEKILINLFRVKLVRKEYAFTALDLDNYLKEFSPVTQAEGELNPEIQMFQNAIDFRSIKIRECMVPRTEINALEDMESIETLRELFLETGHSKILIYNESIDNIIGYTHSFDLFRNPLGIKEILKPVLIVPETMLANKALTLLIDEKKSVAVVVDEFGGTSGMVTMEDIIEEITGEIRDEFDVDDLVERQVGKDEYIFSARLEIDYVNDKYNLNLPRDEEYETLAGLIIHYHESIPELNDEIIVGNFVFTILQASEIRIEQVSLKIRG